MKYNFIWKFYSIILYKTIKRASVLFFNTLVYNHKKYIIIYINNQNIMFEILNKTYEIDILWQTCKYEQLKLYECIEFSYKLNTKDFKLEDWLYNFLKDKIDLKKQDLLKIDLDKMMDVLFDTAFKWFFSKKKWGKSTSYESYIMFLSEKLSIDPNKLVKEYTPEQLNFYTDWVIYNLNEQTKEWQKRNKFNSKMKEMQQEETREEALKRVQEMEKKLKNKS